MVDGDPVRLSPLERGLLAVLAASGGQVVSTDRLVDALWRLRSPRSGRNRVQALVSGLRRSIGAAEVIVTTAPGYRFRHECGGLDATRFADLVRSARAHIADGRQPDGVRMYRAALDLWRGPAFDNVLLQDPLISAEAARLDECRLAVTEELIDAELTLGRHREVAAELIGLVAAHPYRETLRRQLMLGLARSGQAAVALAVYREGRALLHEEMGTEPGPELQALHQAILGADPALLWPGRSPGRAVRADSARASPTRILPNQLPMAIGDFVGRNREIQIVHRRLGAPRSGPSPVIVAIVGIGGIGKTALAIHASRRALPGYPDGVLFVDLRGMDTTPADPHSVLGTFLRSLGVHPEAVPHDFDERLGLFRSVTAGQRLLVILDNAADEAQVRPLVPAGAGCAVIVTARNDLGGLDGADVLRLTGLSAAEGAELLGTLAGVDRLAGSPADRAEIVRLCCGLPLALRIAGVRLAARSGLSFAQLVERLTDEGERLAELAAGDRSVRTSFALSYRRLEPAAAALLRLLSIHPGPHLGVQAVGALGAPGPAEARTLLAELCTAQLVEADGERFRLHDLIRLYAAEQAMDSSAVEAGLRRLVDWYTDACVAGRGVLTGKAWPPAVPLERPLRPRRFTDQGDVLEWFAGEHANAHALLREADRRGWHDQAWRLAYGLHILHMHSHRVDGWAGAVELGVAAAQAAGDPAAEIRIRSGLASACYQLGRPVDAEQHWLATLKLCQDLGEDAELARCHDNLGILHHQRGELNEAAEHHLRALAVPTYTVDSSSAATLHLHLGIVWGDQGRYDDSESSFDSALDHAKDAGNRYLTCVVHHNAAELQLLRGRPDRARAHAEMEVQVARETRLPMREARGLELLGDCEERTGSTRAHWFWQAAIDIYDRVDRRPATVLRTRIAGKYGITPNAASG